ncbi:MAG: 1-(5-phosphoribosyl)-5-[(5-phosphoribosylamino)methylideneamino]imidazole-4-carboxamide isomerase [Candidatus Bathyarchaeota archaeon]|nr:1-(5-phosphoribosyl)-5-[(5-phosphoribosylamino)methylideneamino]imidazole-4-carboxamide isomerase [Candidatus Bathyarchaeota archaeon]
MQLIPAIDLMKGRIVRLSRGDPKTAKIYEQFGDPVQTAQKWQAEGAKKLHIIDLDAALGSGNNYSLISEIVENVTLPIQVGGGIRSFKDAERLLALKIDQVILGALPFNDPSALILIQEKFGPDHVIVALDNRNGDIMIEGWKTKTSMGINEALKKFLSMGIYSFLITSITKDGTLSGPDLETLDKANRNPGAKIIAAGGIGQLEDLLDLQGIGVEGAVIGKALYEERFTLKEAFEKLGGN